MEGVHISTTAPWWSQVSISKEPRVLASQHQIPNKMFKRDFSTSVISMLIHIKKSNNIKYRKQFSFISGRNPSVHPQINE